MKTLFHPGVAGLGLLFALVFPARTAWSQPPPAPSDEGEASAASSDWGGFGPKNGRVHVMGANRVEAGEKVVGDLVSVMGGNVVDGSVSHDVRAVMGNNDINGSVGHDVITVMGQTTINGTVGHDVSGVMGGITLGPNAVIRGDVINVGGTLHRAPGAIVRGRIVSQSYTSGPHTRWSWNPDVTWRHEPGIPDWAEGFHDFYRAWKWVFALMALGLYALLALAFPRGIQRCGDVLVQRPALTVCTTFLAILAIPLMFILLLVTIIGIPVAVFVLPCSILAGAVFGKASLYALIGRSLSRNRVHPAGAVLLGGALCLLLDFVPFLGLGCSIGLYFLGFGCALTALLATRGSPPPVPAPLPPAVPAPIPPPAPSAPPSEAAAAEPAPAIARGTPAPVAAAIPVIPAGLPRAGFWIRMGGLFIDGLIISAIFGDVVINQHVVHEGFHLAGSNCLLPLAVYAALMWKFKGTTIGGMVCGLRVVRLDDKPLEWETVIVRALGCFLSAIFALGFFWIALDPEKQSWHDKIAGTAVVRTKGVKLV